MASRTWFIQVRNGRTVPGVRPVSDWGQAAPCWDPLGR
jgi:hypothetical protein